MAHTETLTDQELIASANAGDEHAFEALYRRYRDWVARLAWRFTGSRDDALDVLQETFLYLLRKFPGFRLTSRLTTFLYPVVKNLALGIRRKQRRAVVDGELLVHLPAPQSQDNGTSRADLAAVLAVLPEGQREVVVMRFVDGFALAEIAAALSIPLGTVKSRLHNALATLRDDPGTRRYFLG